MPSIYCCHCLPCSHFAISCWRGRRAGCVGWRSEEGWGMRCQVRERSCLCQAALTHAADRAHQLTAGLQTSKPNCSRRHQVKEACVQRSAYAACQLAPSRPPPAPTQAPWYCQCWKLQQQECPVCCQVKQKSPSLSPGVKAEPQALPSLSPRPEYSPRPAVLQQYFILKKWDWHFWFPSEATAHPGTFQSMTTHTHTLKRDNQACSVATFAFLLLLNSCDYYLSLTHHAPLSKHT